MLTEFLYETFRLLTGAQGNWFDEQAVGPACAKRMGDAVDVVVEHTSSRLRAVPGYRTRLHQPLATAFKYIDGLAEGVPAPVDGSRSGFFDSPELSAFFVNFQHLQEVFSNSRDVHDLFFQTPDADACYALVCMKREERSQLGMALVGDDLRKDVMQTSVSFTNHQIVSPGVDEAAARCALKCCVFKALIHHARRLISETGANSQQIDHRRCALLRRLSRLEDGDPREGEMQAELAELERQKAQLKWPMETLDDRLNAVVDVLSHPEKFLSSRSELLHIDRMGIKLNAHSALQGIKVPVSEVQIGGGEPRVALLMSFPRSEMLAQPNFLQQADLFLAVQ